MKWDVFISHASEDKDDIARPLAHILNGMGLSVWYDEYELSLGDSLMGKIDEGLASSKYGIVILSKNFFAKEWPKKELRALFSLESTNQKKILPIWHNLTHNDITTYSPLLADKLSISTSDGLLEVARNIVKTLNLGKSQTIDKTGSGKPIKGEVKFSIEKESRNRSRVIFFSFVLFISSITIQMVYLGTGMDKSEKILFYPLVGPICSVLLGISLYYILSRAVSNWMASRLLNNGDIDNLIIESVAIRYPITFSFLKENKKKYIWFLSLAALLLASLTYSATWVAILYYRLVEEMPLSELFTEGSHIIIPILILPFLLIYVFIRRTIVTYRVLKVLRANNAINSDS